MLINLHVINLAIIDEVDIDFSEGFNVLSGETGAGKSIILGSINLALGDKVSKDIIRDVTRPALVELIFSCSDDSVKKVLRESDIDCDSDEIIISRKITPSRSISKINGETVTLAFVHKISDMLIDIHGQHDNKLLINPGEHINILDGFIGGEAMELLSVIENKYREYCGLKKKLKELDVDSESRLREISLLEYEINEIERAGLKTDEDVELEEKFKLMSNMENISETLAQIVAMAGGEALDGISRSARLMAKITGISDYLDSISDSLSQTEDMLSAVIRDIESYLEDNEFDKEEFLKIESRLDLINMFKAKYGSSIKKIMEYCGKDKEKLEELLNSDEQIAQINDEMDKLYGEILSYSSKLSELRKEKAKILCEGITGALQELNFNDALFDMEFVKKADITAKGFDAAQFVIRSNVGEEFKPLSKIASGGELSRVMLAIKSVIADVQDTQTFIFDEIDAGISGRTAQMVAQKLAVLAKKRQIICITHLAQLAAMADYNYVIEKNVADNHTSTQIRAIKDDEIIMELARILGGAQITDAVINSANEMKSLAEEFKKK